MPRVERLLQHALIAFQPAQLTIDLEPRVGESGIGSRSLCGEDPDHTGQGRPSPCELRIARWIIVE